MSLPESSIVKVTVSISQAAVSQQGSGLLSVFGTSAVLPIGQRYGLYSDMVGVGNVFPTSAEEYKAAAVHFSQTPTPTLLMIARMFLTAQPAELIGGPPDQVLTDYTAINNGALMFNADGGAVENVTGINLAGAASLTAVAALVQTAVAAVEAGMTCTYQNGAFILRSGTTGPTSSMTYCTAPGAGTDLAPLMGFQSTQGGILTATGLAVETITQALANVAAVYNDWKYGMLAMTGITDQNNIDGAAWSLANQKVWGYTTSTGVALNPDSQADVGAVIAATSNNRCFGVFDLTGTSPYAVASAFAEAATVDFQGVDTAETLMFKTMPGVPVSNITTSQKIALDAKHYNYYVNVGKNPMLMTGVMADGTWFDQIQGLDWLSAALQDAAVTTFYGAKKVPQTDRGMGTLLHNLSVVLDQAVKNGFLAPGIWNNAGVGQIKTGQLLDKGYYIWADSVDNQAQSVRNTRQAPPITILAKGAGALQGCNILINFEQ